LDDSQTKGVALSGQDGLRDHENMRRAEKMKDWYNTSFIEVGNEGKRAFYIIMFAVVTIVFCCLLVRFSLIQVRLGLGRNN